MTGFRRFSRHRSPTGICRRRLRSIAPGEPGTVHSSQFAHWDPTHRGDHEGYVAGYFLESAINHYLMTDKKDSRLYNAAKKLADCWANHLGPGPTQKPWYDGHQEMEQALVRFGRFVNDMEGGGKGDRYIRTAKFLLDCRYTAAVNPERDRSEYDQSHLPVTQQYEAVGHAVRATYTYSGMADVMVETHDPDYQSAVRSLWDNIVNRKYYVTGGIGSGESAEGLRPELLAAQQRVLRIMFELRDDLLPLEDEPGLPRCPVHRQPRKRRCTTRCSGPWTWRAGISTIRTRWMHASGAAPGILARAVWAISRVRC